MKALLPLLSLAMAAMLGAAPASARTWTSNYGKTVEGDLLSFDGETVTLSLKDGRRAEFKLELLSEDDREYLSEWKEDNPGGKAKAPAQPAPAKPVNREWPDEVKVDMALDEVEVVKEDRDSNTYIYRSPHFEFVADARLSTSVVRDFSRIFEATYEAVRALPINLEPTPPEDGYWDVKLYAEAGDYFKDGGPAGSGGVYSSGTGMVKVPLANLGVKNTGIRYIVDPDHENRTLKHEITHQVMHDLLRYMPVWMIEGFAEFIECMPYSKGRYRFTKIDDSVAEHAAGNDRDYTLVDLESLMKMSHSVWGDGLTNGQAGRNYKSACVLLYYFLKMDAEGDGAGLFAYLDEVRQAKRQSELAKKTEEARDKYLLRGRDYGKLKTEVAAALRSNDSLGLKIDFTEPLASALKPADTSGE